MIVATKGTSSYRQRSRNSKKARRERQIRRFAILGFVILVVVTGIAITKAGKQGENDSTVIESNKYKEFQTDLEIKEDFIKPNKYSRPQTPLTEVNDIVIHYVANPGSSAQANRDYFDNLRFGTSGRYASSHFVVGLNGEIVQCIPLNEISYASNNRNSDTISIECCHPEEDGKFTDETYQALVQLTADLCKVYHLNEEHVIRHYDVTGKLCPLYFVDHEDAWETFKEDVAQAMK
ncbi:MAG: N-acetylmuramoyl-L-alanine amidase [Lachnospiraceae bacterium]|nr:N-acetylmuramoyl-L-alanine amidase [Lachnospiraceae bacterium]